MFEATYLVEDLSPTQALTSLIRWRHKKSSHLATAFCTETTKKCGMESTSFEACGSLEVRNEAESAADTAPVYRGRLLKSQFSAFCSAPITALAMRTFLPHHRPKKHAGDLRCLYSNPTVWPVLFGKPYA